MKLDPRRLRPAELTRLLNSTPLGEVITERELARYRTRAGFALAADSDPKAVDLFRYVAWIRSSMAKKQKASKTEPKPATVAGAYGAHRDRAARRQRELSESGRNIGEIPPVADGERRKRAAGCLRTFAEIYFPAVFNRPWSDDHLMVIKRLETVIISGGQFAFGMPRGSGKTSLCEAAAMWALLNGYRAFVLVIGADKGKAAGILESIQAELETNDLLAADYPEVCFPLAALDGIHQRASGQLHDGRPTLMSFTKNRLVLPSIQGSAASGAIIMVAGITGSVRGLRHKRPDGTAARPDLVLLDDPQDDKSALSPTQCNKRERVIKGAVLGLAGPGKRIAALATVTVIRVDDVAHRLLDRDKNPDWQGQLTKMMYSMPTATGLWDEYRKLREEGLRTGGGTDGANAFYAKHRAEMDAGAKPSWPARFKEDEISAVQSAMNIYLSDPLTFAAEYQNEPIADDVGETSLHVPADLVLQRNRLAGTKRRLCPMPVTRVTGFIDVQSRCLYWLVLGVADDFTAWVIDYGTHPDQTVEHFQHRDCPTPLSKAYPRAGEDGRLYAGLRDLTDALAGKAYPHESGSELEMERLLVDANWSSDVVYRAISESPHRRALTPSHGRGIGASHKPMAMYEHREGDLRGLNWYKPAPKGRRAVRHVLFDTNYWKSFAASRLETPIGDPGSLRLCGDSVSRHKLLADHWAAERAVRTHGQGRVVDEWKCKPGCDNHWFDCLIGAMVAASIAGCRLATPGEDSAKKRRKKLTLEEMKARARRLN